MKTDQLLEAFGLFSARVPRYTSYPPANKFQTDVGTQNQSDWLKLVPDGDAVSLYIHIPFCKRLCWFCACRTQGTQTLRPVNAYVKVLIREIEVLRKSLANGVTMSRLHLGGGTPTILSKSVMDTFLEAIFAHFQTSSDFEFSVEIDPTEAAPELLDTLAKWGLHRASIGVQDFEPLVQSSIGRLQSVEQTRDAIARLRAGGVNSLNLDLLYGLPMQTEDSLKATLKHVIDLQPDRLALYGYAHVPWMSKRQVMIDVSQLPGPRQRYKLAKIAREILVGEGYEAIGIDHFAKPTDSLSVAAASGRLRRNFQGYTDDVAPTLLGLGASGISRFPQGYVQNAVATSAYCDRIEKTGLAGHKGFVLSDLDRLLGTMIEGLMCNGVLDPESLTRRFPDMAAQIETTIKDTERAFSKVWSHDGSRLLLEPPFDALTRIIASHLDTSFQEGTAHSIAV